MIRVLNIVTEEDGPLLDGWGVKIDKEDPHHKYSVEFQGNTELGAKIGIYPDDYMDLTTAQGVDRSVTCKVVSKETDDGNYIPFIQKAEWNEDTTIILLNFQCDIGENIVSVEFENCEAIFDKIWEHGDREVLTIIATGINNNLRTRIAIKYNYLGGNKVYERIFSIPSPITNPSLGIDIESDTETVDKDGLEVKFDIPKFDLSSVCIGKG